MARIPRENPRMQSESMQTPGRKTFSLQCNSATNCATVQPTLLSYFIPVLLAKPAKYLKVHVKTYNPPKNLCLTFALLGLDLTYFQFVKMHIFCETKQYHYILRNTNFNKTKITPVKVTLKVFQNKRHL